MSLRWTQAELDCFHARRGKDGQPDLLMAEAERQERRAEVEEKPTETENRSAWRTARTSVANKANNVEYSEYKRPFCIYSRRIQ